MVLVSAWIVQCSVMSRPSSDAETPQSLINRDSMIAVLALARPTLVIVYFDPSQEYLCIDNKLIVYTAQMKTKVFEDESRTWDKH